MRRYGRMSQQVVDALVEIPGLRVTLEYDDFDYLVPQAVIRFGRGWRGPSRSQVAEAMERGDPPIYLNMLGDSDELAVHPMSLQDDEVEIVARRLREELLSQVDE